ncbi:MAG: baseplate J/gp47 family protein [Gammaproteobacteria bacterium]
MPFSRPTLATLIDRIAGDIESRLPGSDARLRRNLLTILGRAEAGATHGLYGHQEWISLQVIIDTAENDWLERWAAIWTVGRKGAGAAQGNLLLTGTNGAILPAGSSYTRSDGALYTTDADATIVAGTATVAVTASLAGVAGDTDANSTLTLVSSVTGIDAAATVDADGIEGGADIEDDDSLRVRLLDRIGAPPTGGSDPDYVAWAEEVAGVTRAWVYPKEQGPGTVVVRFVTDDAPGGLIPDDATVQAVAASIVAKRTVTADVFVFAPIADPLDLTIQLVPDTIAVRAAVTAEIADMILREAIPAGTLNGSVQVGEIIRSHIDEAISIADGETDHTLLVPTANVQPAIGHIVTLGTITWA